MHLELSLPEQVASHPAFGHLIGTTPAEPVGSVPADDGSKKDDGSPAAAIFNIAILLLIPLGMYFLLIRPQRRRRSEAQALQSSIGVGDEVVTTSGVYGFVSAIEEDRGIIWLEIDDDVQIRVSKAAISGKVSTDAAAAAATADDDDDEAAEAPATPRTARTARASKPSLKGSSKPAPAPEAEADTAEPGTE